MPAETASADDMNSMSGMDMGTEPKSNEASIHDEPQDSHDEEPTQIVLDRA